MGKKDPRIDDYIAEAAPFARPILRRLRRLVHGACPEAAETLKWGMPSFEYGGGILCGIAAFKQHCAFWFWNGERVLGRGRAAKGAMGQFGRIAKLADLPADAVIAGFVRQAAALRDQGVRRKVTPRSERPPPRVPADLQAGLARSKSARRTFDNFPPSKRRDYVEWLTGAKAAATRERRLATALEWLAEGKERHWKYQRK